MPMWFDVLILFIIGFIFLFIEAFIIPGFGFAGIISILCLGFAVYLSFVKLSLVAAVLTTASSAIIIILILKFFPKSPLWKHMRLAKTLNKEEGYASNAELKHLVGKAGKTLAPLHPTGIVLIDNKKYDALTEGSFLEAKIAIYVVRVEGSKVFVRKKEE